MDIATTLRWTAERYPRRTALGGSSQMTYAEWDEHTDRLAASFIRLGLTRGDRVVLQLSGGEPLASAHLALQKAALTSIPLSTRFGQGEVTYCLDDATPALAVVDDATSEALVSATDGLDRPVQTVHIDELVADAVDVPLPPAPDSSDISVMLYTSGTTGKPKGVPRSHHAEHSAATAHLIQTGQPPGAVSLGVMPMFHTMGLRSLLASIVGAGTWVPQTRFDAEQSIELILDNSIDTLYLVPTIYWSLLQTGRLEQACSVKNIAYAGAAMTPTLAQQLVDTVKPERFVNHFGSTEIYTFTIGPDGAKKPGCAGRAGVFSRVRLIDPDPNARPDQIARPGEQGQVAVSMDSPEAFDGYWQRSDANAKSIRDGWYFTGDLATEDEDGDLWVSGRVDDMINSGGENIYPEEIEGTLARCPYVEQVIVVGMPHDKWGSAVTAFIVPRPGSDPATSIRQIDAWSRHESGLPSLKRPKRYIAVDSIPTSAVGKILRRRLVEDMYTSKADSEELGIVGDRR